MVGIRGEKSVLDPLSLKEIPSHQEVAGLQGIRAQLVPNRTLRVCCFGDMWCVFTVNPLKGKLLAGDLRAAQLRNTEPPPPNPPH